MCCWVTGVILGSFAGPVVCAERAGKDIVFKVRFDSRHKDQEAAAWKLLADAKKMVEDIVKSL